MGREHHRPIVRGRPSAFVAIIPVGPGDPSTTLTVHGRAVLDWTVRRLLAATEIDRIVLAVDGMPAALALRAVGRTGGLTRLATAAGPDRAGAIRAGLALAGPSDAVFLCPPDRALGPASAIDELILRSQGVDAVAAARPVRSTLKRVVGGRVVATVPRDDWHADAGPWLFRRDALERALAVAEATGRPVVDDLDLALGGRLRVRLVAASATDLPIRTSADARFAERWLASTGGPTR